MHRFRPLIALVLATLWLPAVAHCGMETLGEVTEERGCCSHDSDTPEASAGVCVADHCGVFDEGHYKAGSESSLAVQPPSPAWAVILPGTWLAFGQSGDAPEPDTWPPAPAERTRRWMFELRAAPLANAPGLIAG